MVRGVCLGGVDGLIHAFKYQRATGRTSAVREREWKLDSLSLDRQSDSKRFSLKTSGCGGLFESAAIPTQPVTGFWECVEEGLTLGLRSFSGNRFVFVLPELLGSSHL